MKAEAGTELRAEILLILQVIERLTKYRMAMRKEDKSIHICPCDQAGNCSRVSQNTSPSLPTVSSHRKGVSG